MDHDYPTAYLSFFKAECNTLRMQVVKISPGQFPPSFFISRCKSKNKKSTKQVDL